MTRPLPDLAEWLSGNNLGQYAQTFSDNNIDLSILADLTEQDLVAMGIVSLGHRKKLLKAIQALKPQSADTVVPPADRAASLARLRETEFRQVTVVFSDLVGSSQLSEELDPDDLQDIIATYRRECSDAITRHGGVVVHYFGDGVMAIWGYPTVREHDAGRAIYAALDIVSAVPAIPGPTALSCRVGICSGPVVVGEIGDGGAVDAMGEALNIAARLQALADPNTVLISESTRRLAPSAFEFQNAGIRELKGVSDPQQIYRALSAKIAASRFDAAHQGTLTSFVGRSSELSLLLDRWQKVKDGDGQIVILSGIPGVGKSRLLHEIKSHIEPDAHKLLCHQGSPYHAQSAFAPVIVQIEQAAHFSKHDTDAERMSKLDAWLPNLPGRPIDPLQLIARLLSIPSADADLSRLSPQQIKNRTISVLADAIMAFAAENPVLCIFEDAHWLDASTLELLELIGSRINRARVLLAVSCRPEFRPTWINHANTTTLSLNRLSQTEGAAMIRDLLKGQNLSAPLLDQIIEKADGVPLFLEELTSSLLSVGSRGVNGRGALTKSPRVPDTLSDALMERLDRVAPSRHVAQIAAVIGREFSADLLSMASHIDEADILSALGLLEQADIVGRVDVWPNARFAFRHALLRDAIYDSLLKSKRQHIHADIAAALEAGFPEVAESQPEILAYHYQEATNHDRAIAYWFTAGQRAVAQYANAEAIANFRKALQLLIAQPETPESIRRMIDTQLAIGIPLIAVHGYASVQTRDAFSHARALCLRMGNVPGYFQALYGLWGHAWMCGQNDDALRMAEEFMSRASKLPDPVPVRVAHRVLGSTLLTIGDFQASVDQFDHAIALSSGEKKQPLYNLYMVEPQAASQLLQSWALWFLGYPDRALSRVSETLAFARNLGHPYTLAFACYMTSVVHLLRGDAGAALVNAERCSAISKEQRFSLYVILSKVSRGRAMGDVGHLEEGRAEVASGIADARREGIGFMLPMMEGWLADMHARAGENERALAAVEGILAGVGIRSGRSWEAELIRQRARYQLAVSPSGVAEAASCLQTSIDVARKQSARSLELRATTDLAELRRSQGRSDDARSLLAPLLSVFDEGEGTADIRRARDVLRNCA